MIIEPAPWKRTIHEKVFDEDGNPMKDQEGNELTQEVERTYQGFKVGHVFALEDTSGKACSAVSQTAITAAKDGQLSKPVT